MNLKTHLSEAYRIGLESSIEAIESDYKPKKVRDKLINLLKAEVNNDNKIVIIIVNNNQSLNIIKSFVF